MNDEQLKNFLQKNQPLPPTLNKTENADQLQQLLQRIGPRSSPRPYKPYWVTVAAAFASLFIYFSYTAQNLDKDTVNIQPIAQEQTITTSFEDEEIFVDADLPTLGIGEDYLILAGSNQIQ